MLFHKFIVSCCIDAHSPHWLPVVTVHVPLLAGSRCFCKATCLRSYGSSSYLVSFVSLLCLQPLAGTAGRIHTWPSCSRATKWSKAKTVDTQFLVESPGPQTYVWIPMHSLKLCEKVAPVLLLSLHNYEMNLHEQHWPYGHASWLH